MSNENTQLVSAESYDVNNMIFSEPIVGNIPDSKPPISYQRVMISTENGDGTTGELILPTEEVFTFGVGENLNQDTGKINGYVLPLCLYNNNGPTEQEKNFVEKFNEIVDKCKEYLIENKETLGQYELEMNDLKKFNPLYYKKEKGKVVEGSGPTLYGKLITSKKNGIVTKFYDLTSGEPVNPLDFMGVYGYAKAAIKFESIFIGNKISLQIKVYECDIKPSNTGMKRLLRRPEADTRVLSQKPKVKKTFTEDDIVPSDDEKEKEVKEDEDDVQVPVEKKKKKIVKRKKDE